MPVLRVTEDQARALLGAAERLYYDDLPPSSPQNRKVATLERTIARQMREQGYDVAATNASDGRPR